MKELGNYLKKLRESQNLNLEDVAKRTKIHKYKLSAIEEGDKAALPAKVFCIGLIKSYARELRADMDKVDQFCEEAFREETSLPVEEPTPSSSTRHDDELTQSQPVGRFQIPRSLGIIISLVVILSLIVGIYFVIEKLNSYSEEEALPPSVYSETEEEDETDLNTAASEEVNPTEQTQDQATASESTEKTNTNIVEEKSKTVSEESKPTETKTSDSEKTPPASKAFEENNNFAGDVEEESSVVESDNKLVITALEPIRAEIIWADGFVQVMLLKSNESKTLVFSTPIKLKVNNGGAVQVSFNDEEKKVPGKFNKPIELEFP